MTATVPETSATVPDRRITSYVAQANPVRQKMIAEIIMHHARQPDAEEVCVAAIAREINALFGYLPVAKLMAEARAGMTTSPLLVAWDGSNSVPPCVGTATCTIAADGRAIWTTSEGHVISVPPTLWRALEPVPLAPPEKRSRIILPGH